MGSFVELMEEVVEDVSTWAVALIQEAVDYLSPDGRPFDMIIPDEEMRLEEYLKLRGNPMAWAQFIDTKTQEITQKLQEVGIDAAKIDSIHPYDMAYKIAAKYSYDMEMLIDGNKETLGRVASIASGPGY